MQPLPLRHSKKLTQGGTGAWLFPRARSDMLFALDNGWQRGPEPNSDKLLWVSRKWPMFGQNSTTALEPLTRMANFVQAQGWRGLGLWVAGGDGVGEAEMKVFDRAGVLLLKADGGDDTCRKTALARRLAPKQSQCPTRAATRLAGGGDWPTRGC